jgi:hypothetical protein
LYAWLLGLYAVLSLLSVSATALEHFGTLLWGAVGLWAGLIWYLTGNQPAGTVAPPGKDAPITFFSFSTTRQ